MFLVPQPQKIKYSDEKFNAASLKEKNQNDLKALIQCKKDNSLKEEGYTLIISPKEIRVTYKDEEALYRAMTTLKQLVLQNENDEIPCVEIEDYPSIKNRGLMADVSRGKMPKLSELKALVDILSDLKYNQLQLYMDSFVYEYKNFSEYGKEKEPYTKEDIKELSKYCKERYIELVPNQNGFGHMGVWLNKKELSDLSIQIKKGVPTNTLNPFDERSIEFIDKIYDGFLDVFESDKVNIGMDEPFELGKGQTKEKCDELGIGNVYTTYLNKVCSLAYNKYHKIPMFWDDIVFKHEDQLENIPKESIVMEWGYETEQHFDRNCEKLKSKNLRFYVCPGTSTWGSFTGRTNNMIQNIYCACETGTYYGAEGFLLTDWGDGGNPQFPVVSIFPYVFGGAYSWNCLDHNHEIAYAQREKVIEECKKYVNKFIFKTDENSDFCDVVIRAGEYYLLENALHFNGTKLNHVFHQFLTKTGKKEDIHEKNLKAVVNHLKDIIKEVDSLKECESVYAKEIKLNCRMASYIAEVLISFKENSLNESLKKELNDINKAYQKLWLIKNKRDGMDIFPKNLEKFTENIFSIK